MTKEKLMIDAAIAAPAITVPWWVEVFEMSIQFGILSATFFIVVIRALIAWRDWRSK